MKSIAEFVDKQKTYHESIPLKLPNVITAIEETLHEINKQTQQAILDEMALEDEVDNINTELDETLNQMYVNRESEVPNDKLSDQLPGKLELLKSSITRLEDIQKRFKLPYNIESGPVATKQNI